MKMLSQTLSFSEKLRALKSFFINTYIKVLFCGQKYPPFSGHWSVSSFIGQKKARISGRHTDSALDGQKKACFPGQFSIVRLET
jgi:hypothetical protein